MRKSLVLETDAREPGDGIPGTPVAQRGRRRQQLRAPRRGGKPTLTVVIASSEDDSRLDLCLAAILPQSTLYNGELIVVRSASSPEVRVLETLYPTARFVLAPTDASLPELRSLGMSEANGDIVVFTGDGIVRESRWLAKIMAKACPPDGENLVSDQPFDWSAYFTGAGVFTRKTLGIGGR
ncbi:MAG: hypothetical protein H7Z74_04255 [Anaerolineae bacterium]|nr:hypothetical protein [Gemmatimonadaceae bacterium]